MILKIIKLLNFKNYRFISLLFITAAYHSGVNFRQMNAVMAEMEVKGLHHSNMVRRESEVHETVEEIAKSSCSTALSEEIGQRYVIH